jgi:hypothetical protein
MEMFEELPTVSGVAGKIDRKVMGRVLKQDHFSKAMINPFHL